VPTKLPSLLLDPPATTLYPCGHWATAIFPLAPHAAIRLNSDELRVCGCAPAIERSGGIAEASLEPEQAERAINATTAVRAFLKESLATDSLDVLMNNLNYHASRWRVNEPPGVDAFAKILGQSILRRVFLSAAAIQTWIRGVH